METSLIKSTQAYRLLYFSPEPETGERVCIGILFSDGQHQSLLFDEKFSKLKCIAPGFEPSLALFYLRDVERELQQAPDPDAVLRTYGSQLQTSTPREIVQPLTESLKLHLFARFVSRSHETPAPPAACYTDRMRNEFTAIVERDGDWYISYCPEIPGANGQGRTAEECRQSLSEAIALILEDRREDALKGLPADATRETVVVA